MKTYVLKAARRGPVFRDVFRGCGQIEIGHLSRSAAGNQCSKRFGKVLSAAKNIVIELRQLTG